VVYTTNLFFVLHLYRVHASIVKKKQQETCRLISRRTWSITC